MPYIRQEIRHNLDKSLNNLIDCIKKEDKNDRDGILNYCIHKMCKKLYREKYIDYNAMIGMLECCKQELYRKLIVPYEEYKIMTNGDV